jgi:hypothetical protein
MLFRSSTRIQPWRLVCISYKGAIFSFLVVSLHLCHKGTVLVLVECLYTVIKAQLFTLPVMHLCAPREVTFYKCASNNKNMPRATRSTALSLQLYYNTMR